MQQYVMQITMKICTKEILVLIPFCMFFQHDDCLLFEQLSLGISISTFPSISANLEKDHACYNYIHYCLELSLEVLNTYVNQFNFLF